jgi:ATP-binding cassette subfamily F protein 3
MFSGEDVFKTVSVLSGGERARLTLCKLILSHMNLLVLDEPTNHLDIDSREALEEALEGFDGTILTVSHDRYFIDKLATRILMMHPGEAFEGDLLDYAVEGESEGYTKMMRYKTAREAERLMDESAIVKSAAVVTDAKADYLKNKQNAAEERKKRNRLQKLREECARIEEELCAIEEEMAGDAATDYKRVGELEERKNALEEQLLLDYEELEELETWAASQN